MDRCAGAGMLDAVLHLLEPLHAAGACHNQVLYKHIFNRCALGAPRMLARQHVCQVQTFSRQGALVLGSDSCNVWQLICHRSGCDSRLMGVSCAAWARQAAGRTPPSFTTKPCLAAQR